MDLKLIQLVTCVSCGRNLRRISVSSVFAMSCNFVSYVLWMQYLPQVLGVSWVSYVSLSRTVSHCCRQCCNGYTILERRQWRPDNSTTGDIADSHVSEFNCECYHHGRWQLLWFGSATIDLGLGHCLRSRGQPAANVPRLSFVSCNGVWKTTAKYASFNGTFHLQRIVLSILFWGTAGKRINWR